MLELGLYGFYTLIMVASLTAWYRLYFFPYHSLHQSPISTTGKVVGIETASSDDECALIIHFTLENKTVLTQKCPYLFPKNHEFVALESVVPIIYAQNNPHYFIVGTTIDSYKNEALLMLKVLLAVTLALFLFGYLLLKILQ